MVWGFMLGCVLFGVVRLCFGVWIGGLILGFWDCLLFRFKLLGCRRFWLEIILYLLGLLGLVVARFVLSVYSVYALWFVLLLAVVGWCAGFNFCLR